MEACGSGVGAGCAEAVAHAFEGAAAAGADGGVGGAGDVVCAEAVAVEADLLGGDYGGKEEEW